MDERLLGVLGEGPPELERRVLRLVERERPGGPGKEEAMVEERGVAVLVEEVEVELAGLCALPGAFLGKTL